MTAEWQQSEGAAVTLKSEPSEIIKKALPAKAFVVRNYDKEQRSATGSHAKRGLGLRIITLATEFEKTQIRSFLKENGIVYQDVYDYSRLSLGEIQEGALNGLTPFSIRIQDIDSVRKMAIAGFEFEGADTIRSNEIHLIESGKRKSFVAKIGSEPSTAVKVAKLTFSDAALIDRVSKDISVQGSDIVISLESLNSQVDAIYLKKLFNDSNIIHEYVEKDQKPYVVVSDPDSITRMAVLGFEFLGANPLRLQEARFREAQGRARQNPKE